MKDNLKKLILLQECDSKIRSIDVKRDSIPIKIKKLEEIFNETASVFKAKFDKLDLLKKERRSLEQQVQDIESKAVKSQEKLNNIKSNKEYTAALKEIKDLEREKGKSEDKILQIMESVEVLNSECDEIKDDQDKLEERFEKDKKEIEEELLELDKEVEDLIKQRTGYNDAVDPKMLKTYNRLREKRTGVAVSAVIDGTCQGCHLGIPPQKFNELKRCDKMMSCPHCNRLIYWGEDLFFVELLNDINGISE